MRKIIFPLLLFVVQFAFSQVCDFYPNKATVFTEYGVKKLIRYAQKDGEAVPVIQAVYLIDSTGCAYKSLLKSTGDKSKLYTYSYAIGGLPYGHKMITSGYYTSDSTEVMTHSKEEFYYSNGMVYQTVVRVLDEQSGKFKKVISTYGPNEPEETDRKTWMLLGETDTIEKTIDKTDRISSTSLRYTKKNSQWTETERNIILRNENGRIVEERKYKEGELTSGTRYSIQTLGNGLEQTLESDLKGNPIRKTVITDNRGSYEVYEFKSGKWNLLYEETMPYADPIPDKEPYVKEDINTIPLKKTQVSPPVKLKAKPFPKEVKGKKRAKKISGLSGEEKVYYRDEVKKEEIILKEKYTKEGLLTETYQALNGIRYTYTYEFY